jgi:hypothetical protein
MSTSRPPLIFLVTMPSTTSPSFCVSTMRCQASMRSALRLESWMRPSSPSRSSRRTSISSPGLMSDPLELFLGDEAFALEAHFDHDVVTGEADDLALDELAGGQIRDLLLEEASPCTGRPENAAPASAGDSAGRVHHRYGDSRHWPSGPGELATRHTPHATRHTPHATRHTPHATRHTPHATRHTPPSGRCRGARRARLRSSGTVRPVDIMPSTRV